ncbi:MAG: C25 family peptidase propeptide domain-containing protein [bacterium]
MPGEKPVITIIENTTEHTVFIVDIPGMWGDYKEREGIVFDYVELPEYGHTHDIGFPQMPTIQELFAIPVGGNNNVQVNILSSQNTFIDNYYVYPKQRPFSYQEIEKQFEFFDYNEGFYNSDAWYPLDSAGSQGPGTFRDFDVIDVVLTPMKFNPVQRKIEVRYQMLVEVRYISSLGGDYYSKYKPSKDFQKMYPYIIENLKDSPWIWEFDSKKTSSLNPDYVIIYDDILSMQPGFDYNMTLLKNYLIDRGFYPVDYKLSNSGGRISENI